jgi:GT2 family glycosyltransferase
MTVQIITPYVNDSEIQAHKELFWDLNVYYEKDVAGIGSDLMFQRMWKQFKDDDIFILHADMYPHHDGWFSEVLSYVNKFPNVGMFGCLLLYPAKDKHDNLYIQSAGGRFTDNNPDHYGSGLLIDTQTKFKELEIDQGQYDNVREVAWTTFGGCYIRRSLINKVGDFSSEYEWTYNRDVDYCLTARSLNEKIYQIPVRLYHYESKDNKIIKAQDANKVAAEYRNLVKLKNKWINTDFYKTLDKVIQYE